MQQKHGKTHLRFYPKKESLRKLVSRQRIPIPILSLSNKRLIWGFSLIKSLRTLVLVAAILLLTTSLFGSSVFAEQNGSPDAITSAQNTLKTCYEAAEQAQAAGANVTSLMDTLNDAAGLLTESELAYASNDYNSANNYPSQSQSALNGFTSQASALQQNAENSHNQSILTVILSVIGSIAILGVGIGAWVTLNRKQRQT